MTSNLCCGRAWEHTGAYNFDFQHTWLRKRKEDDDLRGISRTQFPEGGY